ncbi:hypothetical protein HHK36_026930 [Tetracentron sinense]|uniref:Uncharacterized protein n=1 Tax=Tetracentron sinense TaxID=13715 RepID=A0A835D5Y2_TETSI|nr:hypothetical protein HHK36_026930 [Tetracentron sinense]
MAPQIIRPDSLSISSPSELDADTDLDLDWPFGKIDGVDGDDLRETAYEIFFTACRSSPGFGGRSALTYYPTTAQDIGEGVGGNGVGISRIKRSLGLKAMKRSSPRRVGGSDSNSNSNPSSPRGHGSSNSSPGLAFTVPPMRPKRPLTSAEIMRQQMRVTEQSDNRLRKTLMRTLVGQMGRRAETIILPLELLRHLKPSEFNDTHEYHLWQKRQLKILEAGLLLYPSVPLDPSNTFVTRLRDIIRGSETKPIDTDKNSETMRTLCTCVISLSSGSPNESPTDVCHWADGFPINIHLYISLLHSIFDMKDETLVLDEIDELLDLIKKTWSTLGINRLIHNVCFTWVLFQQYVATAQAEQDLLCACLAMFAELANDVKRADREVIYVKVLSSALASMQGWSEKRLFDYHESFQKGTIGFVENLIPLALSVTLILDEDFGSLDVARQEKGGAKVDSAGHRVDSYIRSSVRKAFTKIFENGNANSMAVEVEEDASKILLQLAIETEDLAMKEKDNFSPILNKWHPIAAGVAAVTLHNCYGVVLKQYLARVSMFTNEAIEVLQRAGKLEKLLVQMVVEDSVECEDGGKEIVREMVPYEVDSITLSLLKTWIDERLKRGRECVDRAKETETWNPKSKTEPYAQSAVEIMKLAKETVNDFFEIPIGNFDDLAQDLADGLELLFQEYTSFVASCGVLHSHGPYVGDFLCQKTTLPYECGDMIITTQIINILHETSHMMGLSFQLLHCAGLRMLDCSKHSYIPTLPPLTRCNRDSKFLKLWKKASPCKVGVEDSHRRGSTDGHHPRPSTSRGTQRLYIRLNTLHYLLSHLHSLDKMLSLSPRLTPSPHNGIRNSHQYLATSPSYFNVVRSSIAAASQHVLEVASYRLIFLDSNSVFYESLYVGNVADSRIRPALRILKQNLTLLAAILTDQVQSLAVKEVMKASFEAYLMVLLAGGGVRIFSKSDHEMIEEDFDSLKRVFCTCGEGSITEDMVEKGAETVEGVVGLMGQCTEQLLEDFSIVACEASGIGIVGAGQILPMPPTTGRWNRADPNTILRVLCHRNDDTANYFLKKAFQLPKRR